MDLFSLRCFVEVARTGGFGRAADRVGRSQPAVSAQIKNLEEQAGGPLFDRTTSRPVLTPRGRELLPRAERLVADFEAFVQVLGGQERPSGTVTLAAGQTILDHLLPRPLGLVRQRHPDIRWRLLNRNYEGIERALAEGQADFAVGWFQTIPDRWVAEPLGRFRFVAVDRTGSDGAELFRRPRVTFEEGNHTRRWLEERLGPGTVALELTGTESILRYVERGFGAAIVPDYCLSPARRARLTVVPLDDRLPELTLHLVRRNGAPVTPAAAVAAEALRSWQLPSWPESVPESK